MILKTILGVEDMFKETPEYNGQNIFRTHDLEKDKNIIHLYHCHQF